MRLAKSVKYSLVFFILITIFTIIFKKNDLSPIDIRKSGFPKGIMIMINELLIVLSISLPPTIIIFLVYYFYIVKDK